jgi:recombinational DNA repair protein RecR
MTIDDEVLQRVCPTIRATKSILMVVFNPKEFAVVDLLLQDTPFTATYFVNNTILPLANRQAHQIVNIGRCRPEWRVISERAKGRAPLISLRLICYPET